MNLDILKKYTPIKITHQDINFYKTYDYDNLYKAHKFLNIYFTVNFYNSINKIYINYEQYNQRCYYVYLSTEKTIVKENNNHLIYHKFNNLRYKTKNNMNIYYDNEKIISKTIYIKKFFYSWYNIKSNLIDYENMVFFNIYKINNYLYYSKSIANINFIIYNNIHNYKILI